MKKCPLHKVACRRNPHHENGEVLFGVMRRTEFNVYHSHHDGVTDTCFWSDNEGPTSMMYWLRAQSHTPGSS